MQGRDRELPHLGQGRRQAARRFQRPLRHGGHLPGVPTELVNIERLPIRVTDDGFTRIDPQGKQIDCAMSWKDLAAFEDFLVARLTGSRKRLPANDQARKNLTAVARGDALPNWRSTTAASDHCPPHAPTAERQPLRLARPARCGP